VGGRSSQGAGHLHRLGAGTLDQAVQRRRETYSSACRALVPVALHVAPFWWANRSSGAAGLTTGDYFEARFSRGLASFYVIVGFATMAVTIGIMLKGSGAIIAAVTGNAVPPNYAILGVTVILLVYGVLGGFSAAVVTDFLQGCLTIVFSFLLLPFAIYKLGGFSGLHAGVAASVGSAANNMWSLVAPGDIGVFYIVSW